MSVGVVVIRQGQMRYPRYNSDGHVIRQGISPHACDKLKSFPGVSLPGK